MKKTTIITAALIILMVSFLAIPAFGSVITSAVFRGVITISNNSTAETNVATVFTGNTTAWVDNDIMNSSGNNTAIRTSSGADVPYMPGYGPSANPWVLWVPSIAAETYSTDILFTGGTDNMDAAIRYFPGATGMTVPDDPSLELSDNSTIEQQGWVDTDNATGKNLVNKLAATRTFVSPTVSGNVTSVIFGSANTTIQSFTINDDTNRQIYGAQWASQTFTTANTSVVDYVELLLYRVLTPGTITVSIRNTTTGGLPAGSDLTSATRDGDEFTTAAAGLWYTFDFTDYDLDQGVTYAIVVRATTGDAANYLNWRYDNAAGYLGGQEVQSLDSGASWTAIPADDFMFSVEGWTDSAGRVSATGVASEEHTIDVGMDSPFFGLGIDASTFQLPVTANLTMNAPLPQSECSSSPFTTIDSNAYTCVVSGATWTNQGYSFDGGNDYIEVNPTPAELNFTTGNFTYAFWLYTDDVTTQEWIINRGAFNTDGYYITILNGGVYATSHQAAAHQDLGTGVVLSINTMHHIVVVRVGASITFYVDNVAHVGVGTAWIDPLTSARTLKIGIRDDKVSSPFGGVIGEIRAYAYAFSADDVEQNYNATKSKYSTGDIYIYSTLASVPDNGNGWVFYQNYAMPYVSSTEVTVGGSQVGYWEWEYGATFTDQSGNGNTATPSFRTTSSDADVSASLSSFLPISEAKAPAYTLSSAPTFFTTTPGVSGNFTVNASPTYPGSGVITAIAAAGAVPETLPTLIFSTFGLILVSLCVSYMMKTTGVNSLFIKMCIITAGMCILAAFNIYDVWQVYFFALIGISLCWISRQREAY